MQPLARLGGHRKAEGFAIATESASRAAILSSTLEGNVWNSEVLLVDVTAPLRPAPVLSALRLPTTAACLISLPRHNRLFAGGDDGSIYSFPADGTAKGWASHRLHHAPVMAMATCSDGTATAPSHVVSVDMNGGLALWTSAGTTVAEAAAAFPGSRGAATSVAIASMAADAAVPVVVSGHRDGSLSVLLAHADAGASVGTLRPAARCEGFSASSGAVTALAVVPAALHATGSAADGAAAAAAPAPAAATSEVFLVAGYEDGSLAILAVRSPGSAAAAAAAGAGAGSPAAAGAGEAGWSVSLLTSVAAHKSAVRSVAVAPAAASASSGAGSAGAAFTVISGGDDTAVMATPCAFARSRGSAGSSSRAAAAPAVGFTAVATALPGHAHSDYVACVAVIPAPPAAPALPAAVDGSAAAAPAPAAAAGLGYAIVSGSWDGTVLMTPVA